MMLARAIRLSPRPGRAPGVPLHGLVFAAVVFVGIQATDPFLDVEEFWQWCAIAGFANRG